MTHPYEPRIYREKAKPGDLESFRVVVEETDLWISVDRTSDEIVSSAKEVVRGLRADIKAEILYNPSFAKSFVPVQQRADSAAITTRMAEAARIAGVGPMASVAGAVADFVGQELKKSSSNVIVENGGDILVSTNKSRTVQIFAGRSPLSKKIGVVIPAASQPLGICTSSGTVGHSFSFGKADAVVIASETAALADAFATAIGNKIVKEEDIDRAISNAKAKDSVLFVATIKGTKMGLWGEFEVVPLAKASQ